MNLLHLAPDIQEALLFLPRTLQGRDPICEKDVRPIAAVPHWHCQRKMWATLAEERLPFSILTAITTKVIAEPHRTQLRRGATLNRLRETHRTSGSLHPWML